MLPTFLHIGAPKCASTWLWRMCLEHPEVYAPPEADNVNFFLSTYHRGMQWYEENYFGAYAGEPVAGEFSNSYALSDLALERIAADLPGVRLTLTVREPAERAYINWAYEKRKRGWTPEQKVDIALAFHPNRWQFFRRWVEPGLCGAALRRVYRLFPPACVKVLFHEDLEADASAFLSEFFAFIGADSAFRPPSRDERINPDREGEDVRHCPQDLRRELRRAVRDDVLLLQELTGRDLGHWL